MVVEVPRARPLVRLDPYEVVAELEEEGSVARVMGSYEDRQSQRDMAAYIADAYNDGGTVLLEAGTGVGKSFAYLVPALLWARTNDERTIVSTNTINLQEQLVGKDLPLLRDALATDEWQPTFALLKGWRNYLCLARLEVASAGQQSLLEESKLAELESIAAWAGKTSDGTFGDLPTPPSGEVWDEVSAEPDLCPRLKCPHFDRCFLFRARRKAAEADVVVVNHHLFAADLAVRKAADNWDEAAVLPPYKRLILDEGHHLEDVAAAHLGAAALQQRGAAAAGSDGAERPRPGADPGPGADARRRRPGAGQPDPRPGAAGARDRRSPSRGRGDVRPAPDPGLERAGRRPAPADRRLRAGSGLGRRVGPGGRRPAPGVPAGGRRGRDDRRPDESERADRAPDPAGAGARGVLRRLDAGADAITATLRPVGGGEPVVRWIEKKGARGQNVAIAAVPLDLAPILRELVFDRVETVVLTSATLAAGGDFRFLESRLGLEQSPSPVTVREILPSPFDYASQCLFGIPADRPTPGRTRPAHDAAVAATIRDLVTASDGGLFALFTSHAALRRAAARLRSDLGPRWPLLVQGEGSRESLLRRFREAGNAILLGTDSFWEGVDVPGRALRALVLCKLPFKVPSEPLTAARLERLAERAKMGFSATCCLTPRSR